MSDITIKNLPPAPYFARFLEGQEARTLKTEEMQAVQGGQYVTLAAPSDSDTADFPRYPNLPLGNLEEDIHNKLREAFGSGMPIPGYPKPEPYEPEIVTLAYPSDSDIVGS